MEKEMSEQEYWKRNYSFALEACNNEVKARRRVEAERDQARRLAEKYYMYAVSGTFPSWQDEGIPWEKDDAL